MSLLAASCEAHEPETKRMPVDTEDDLKSQQWIFEGKAQKTAVSKSYAFARECSEEFAFLAAIVVDCDHQAFSRW